VCGRIFNTLHKNINANRSKQEQRKNHGETKSGSNLLGGFAGQSFCWEIGGPDGAIRVVQYWIRSRFFVVVLSLFFNRFMDIYFEVVFLTVKLCGKASRRELGSNPNWSISVCEFIGFCASWGGGGG